MNEKWTDRDVAKAQTLNALCLEVSLAQRTSNRSWLWVPKNRNDCQCSREILALDLAADMSSIHRILTIRQIHVEAHTWLLVYPIRNAAAEVSA
jgi:hypothetical protein